MAPTRVFHGLSTCQYVEFYSAFLTSILYITMDKSDVLIAEVMDDTNNKRSRENRKPRQVL
jgi:hypothetical protein